MESATTEFSFVLKPSEHGIGVFTTHNIQSGTLLRLFGNEKEFDHRISTRNKGDVPEEFRDYCIDRGEKLICPEDFGCMPVGWYLNHSSTPNAFHKDYNWYASRDIRSNEEILIDYNSLEEPGEARDEYYNK